MGVSGSPPAAGGRTPRPARRLERRRRCTPADDAGCVRGAAGTRRVASGLPALGRGGDAAGHRRRHPLAQGKPSDRLAAACLPACLWCCAPLAHSRPWGSGSEVQPECCCRRASPGICAVTAGCRGARLQRCRPDQRRAVQYGAVLSLLLSTRLLRLQLVLSRTSRGALCVVRTVCQAEPFAGACRPSASLYSASAAFSLLCTFAACTIKSRAVINPIRKWQRVILLRRTARSKARVAQFLATCQHLHPKCAPTHRH